MARQQLGVGRSARGRHLGGGLARLFRHDRTSLHHRLYCIEQLIDDLVRGPTLGLAVEIQGDAMPQHTAGDGPDAFDRSVRLAVQHRVGLGAEGQVLRPLADHSPSST